VHQPFYVQAKEKMSAESVFTAIQLLARTPLCIVRATAVSCGKVPLSALDRRITILACTFKS